MKPKKSQILSHALIYIISFIIIVFILIFGYKAISLVSENAYKAELYEMQKQLENAVAKMRNNFGSVDILSLKVPLRITELCFTDNHKVDTLQLDAYPIIQNSIESGSGYNVFFIEKIPETMMYINGLELAYPYFLCLKPVGNSIRITLEGKGNTVLITSNGLVQEESTLDEDIMAEYGNVDNDLHLFDESPDELFSDLNSIDW